MFANTYVVVIHWVDIFRCGVICPILEPGLTISYRTKDDLRELPSSETGARGGGGEFGLLVREIYHHVGAKLSSPHER